MDITPLITRDKKIIQSYRDVFKVSGIIYQTSIIVLPDEVIDWPQGIGSVKDFTLSTFNVLAGFQHKVDILLLGTGMRQILLPQKIRQEIRDRLGISVEAMDTGAACRSYNVLLAEGRKIAAALMNIKEKHHETE